MGKMMGWIKGNDYNSVWQYEEYAKNFAKLIPESVAMMAFCGLPMRVAAEPMFADMAMATI